MNTNNIAMLLGDPSGIGPELISKLLSEEITNKANVIIIGEKNILEQGNMISGKSQNLNFVEKFEQINFENQFHQNLQQILDHVNCQKFYSHFLKYFFHQ